MLSRLLEIICMLLLPYCCDLLRVRCQISLLTEQIDLFLQPGKLAEDMVYCSGFSVVGGSLWFSSGYCAYVWCREIVLFEIWQDMRYIFFSLSLLLTGFNQYKVFMTDLRGYVM